MIKELYPKITPFNSFKLKALPNDLGMTDGDTNADGYDIFIAFNHDKDDAGFLIAAGLGHHEIHANVSAGNDDLCCITDVFELNNVILQYTIPSSYELIIFSNILVIIPIFYY